MKVLFVWVRNVLPSERNITGLNEIFGLKSEYQLIMG
jgi:hypothetical protein